MKITSFSRYALMVLLLVFAAVSSGICARSADTVYITVASDGNDSMAMRGFGPFRSLNGAILAARSARAENGPKPAVIDVLPGRYLISDPVVFTSEDSGEKGAEVIVRAHGGGGSVFTGSNQVTGWKPLSEEMKKLIPDPAAKQRIYYTSLKSIGILSFGDPAAKGQRPDLYSDGELQILARWPDKGFTRAGLAMGQTETPPTYLRRGGTVEGAFGYMEERQNRWAGEKDPRAGGYWYWDWSEEYQTIRKIDTVSHVIYLAEPYHRYGYRDSLKYFGLNLLCELDSPGEWFIDREEGIIFWYPPSGTDPVRANVTLSVFSEPYMVSLVDCRWIRLEGLAFEESRGSGARISGGANCTISDCRFSRMGVDGIAVENGSGHTVSGCYIEDLGYGGMKISGGDRKSLAPSEHVVEDCVVEDFSLFKRTYEPAIHLSGCGTVIRNNLFRRSSSSALRLEGNDFIIEYNRISDVVSESDDQGGLDIYYNPSYQGIVIRYNHWKDIRGGTLHGAAGVRLDDMISDVTVSGNIFERCGALDFGAVQINGGKGNVISGNIFFDCNAAVSFTVYSAKRWETAMQTPEIQRKLYDEVNILSEVYAGKYPHLAKINEDLNRNLIYNNILAGCRHDYLRPNKFNVLKNNREVSPASNNLESFLRTTDLKACGLEQIEYDKIGPRSNNWLKE